MPAVFACPQIFTAIERMNRFFYLLFDICQLHACPMHLVVHFSQNQTKSSSSP